MQNRQLALLKCPKSWLAVEDFPQDWSPCCAVSPSHGGHALDGVAAMVLLCWVVSVQVCNQPDLNSQPRHQKAPALGEGASSAAASVAVASCRDSTASTSCRVGRLGSAPARPMQTDAAAPAGSRAMRWVWSRLPPHSEARLVSRAPS